MKLGEYLLKYDPVLLLSQAGCSSGMLELAKVALSSHLIFPRIQMSMGYGASPPRTNVGHIYTWFPDHCGKPRVVALQQCDTKSKYYLGLWFCRSLIDPNDQCIFQAKAVPGVFSRGDWVWLSASSSDLNKGVINAFFRNG